MIGERIRRARLVAGLSQREVVERLSLTGTSLTKAGLSKYERGGSTPKARVILQLAKALGVTPGYFYEEQKVEIEWLGFRMNATLGSNKQERIKCTATEVIEGQIWLQQTFHGSVAPKFPKKIDASCPEDAETAAASLRKAWMLGDLPIESVTRAIEDNGGVVVEVFDCETSFHGLSGWANRKYPIAVTSANASVDRKRFNLAHELGHLMMDSGDQQSRAGEKLFHRFAAAFIVPPAVARNELGGKRKALSLEELALLKKKHGLSMQAWIFRARDLEIIDGRRFNALWRELSARGWRKVEPIEYEGHERPGKLRQMIHRALAEGIISHSKARQICPDYLDDVDQLLPKTSLAGLKASDVIKMSSEERRKILRRSAQIMEDEYASNEELTVFESVDGEIYEEASDG
jgi:Zn-dependent peptidase ImmA (M78 family)/transcriptional regulator with XRE-family HTH domain